MSRHKIGTYRRDSGEVRERRTADRVEKGGGDAVGIDEEESDRRMMEEIKQRMDERKASKEIGSGRIDPKDLKARTCDAAPLLEKESGKSLKDVSKMVAKDATSRRGLKKASSNHTVSESADAAQRKEALQWASGAASGTAIDKERAADEVTVRPKVAQETTSEKACTATLESEDLLAAQEFIAAQYPPVGEVVSSAIRMGRALVSGALGMQTDDPKLFETAIKLPDCEVVIQSTRKKAKRPVSAAPPNSKESEVDSNESGDVQQSQSATDVGICIELPGGEIEPTTPTESHRILKEIDGSKLLQEELIRQDPSLASVSSFLSTVCGGGTRDKNIKKKDEAKNKEADTEIEIIPLSVQTRSEARYMEKQHTNRIVAAKSLLVEELAKARPSAEPIVTFHATADGEDKSGKEDGTNELTVMRDTAFGAYNIPHFTGPVTTEIEVPYEVENQVDEIDESQVIVSDDDAMSVGDSEGGSSGSDGFSRTDSNSSHSESNRSHGSRKRPADKSPEREWDETRRREFPSSVTRSEGGCRIYVPSSMRAGAFEVMSQLVTDAADTTNTADTADTTNTADVADTTDAPGAQCASTETLCASRETNVTYGNDLGVIMRRPR